MKLTEHQKYHLKKFVKKLKSHTARHTEFVTVYIPAGYDISKIIQHLAKEQGTATNIKSAQTKKNVIDALERMIQHLKLFKRTPANGLAIFAGNVASKTGGNDVQVWSVEPPIPIKMRMYRCDKNFQLDLLFEILETKETYGLVVIDARDAILALLKGKSIVPLVSTHSHIPGKMKAGGQSAARFARNREIAIHDHYKKVADIMKEQFLAMTEIKGIIVGGPGPSKYAFVETGLITGDLKRKIIGIKDLSYTGDFGLEELVERSQDLLAHEEITEEKRVVAKFLEKLAREPNMVTYGEVNTRKALERGAVELLLISESCDEEKVEEFEEKAREFSTEVKIISTDTREGVQLRDIGKMGAMLRYAIE